MSRAHGTRGGLAGLMVLAGLIAAPTAHGQNCDHCREPCPPWIKYHQEGPPRIKFKHGCPKPICDWCNLPHYGYFPTCWRPWAFPPDWSHCPVPPPGALVPLIPPSRGATYQEPPQTSPPPRPDDRKDPNIKPPIDPTSSTQPAWLPPLSQEKSERPARGETRMDGPRGETPGLAPVQNNEPPLAPAPKVSPNLPAEKSAGKEPSPLPVGPVAVPPLPVSPGSQVEVPTPPSLSKSEAAEPKAVVKTPAAPKAVVEAPAPPMPPSGIVQTGALASRDEPQRPRTIGSDGSNMRMVNSRRIMLDYELDGATKDSLLELWYTQDGKKWHRDPTTVQSGAPHMIEVNKEGTYGFTLVARKAEEKGESPAPGESPQVWVEVDWTKPSVNLVDVRPSTSSPDRQLSVVWIASDNNLARQPVTLSWSETMDGPWKSFATNVENTGRYVWQMPNSVPGRFYLRVEAFDLVGNVGTATTPTPVVVSSR